MIPRKNLRGRNAVTPMVPYASPMTGRGAVLAGEAESETPAWFSFFMRIGRPSAAGEGNGQRRHGTDCQVLSGIRQAWAASRILSIMESVSRNAPYPQDEESMPPTHDSVTGSLVSRYPDGYAHGASEGASRTSCPFNPQPTSGTTALSFLGSRPTSTS